jgi:GNAT superfamily N-acetyltransferase
VAVLVSLREGESVVVRPVGPTDRTLLLAAFDRFGDGSRYQRYLIPKQRLTDDELRFFADVDHRDHEAIGAIDPLTSQGVGIARYLRDPEHPEKAEAAVAVVDEWQGKGLGRVLMSRLATRARRQGIRTFTATLLTDDRAMRALFEELGEVRVHPDGSAIEIEVGLDDAQRVLSTAARASASYGLRA